MTLSANQFFVLNGPSKNDLKDALFSPTYKGSHGAHHAKLLTFTSDGTLTDHEVQVKSVQCLNRMGTHFYISGWSHSEGKGEGGPKDYRGEVHILYRTDSRKGGISFDENVPSQHCLSFSKPRDSRWNECRPDVKAALDG